MSKKRKSQGRIGKTTIEDHLQQNSRDSNKRSQSSAHKGLPSLFTKHHPRTQSHLNSHQLQQRLLDGKVREKSTWVAILQKLKQEPTFLKTVNKESPKPKTAIKSQQRIPGAFQAQPKQIVAALSTSRKKNVSTKPKINQFLQFLPEIEKTVPQVPSVDWADSQLEKQIKANKFKFNQQKDPSIYTPAQVHKLYKVKNFKFSDYKTKLKNTIEKLKSQLQMKNFPRYSVNDYVKAFKICKQLLDVRNTTVDTIAVILQREKLLDTLLVEGSGLKQNLHPVFSKLNFLSSQVVSLIQNWKALNIPYRTFLYKGQDYQIKIEEDQQLVQESLGHLLNPDQAFVDSTITNSDLNN